jgi:hypothetical protein
MANEKILNTRIQLKYDSYAAWVENNPTLKPGEIAIAKLVSDVTIPTDEAKNAPVLFKVGPGKFNDLPWASALAADVHSWAKKSEDEFKTWVNTIVEHPAAPVIETGSANGTISVDGNDVEVKGLGSAAYTDSTAYATAEQGTKADNAAATIATYGDIVTHNAAEFAPANIDTGVHSVALASGTNNGTVKLTVDGNSTDNIAVTGLGDAAYVTVESLNATAKNYADAVLGTDADEAGAQTVHGANKLAAAAKARIDAFIDGTAEAESAIDTLVEIQQYMNSDTEAFTALSERVTNVENGTTATTAGDLTAALETEIKGYTVANAEQLGGHSPEHYATAASVTEITQENGTIDSKIAAYNTSKKFGDIITHNVAEFATSSQGERADSAVQDVTNVANNGLVMSKSADNKVSVDWDPNVVFVFNCGSSSTLVD